MEQTTHVCFLSFCVDPCYNPHVEPCVAAYPHFFHAFSRQIRFFWKSVEAVSAFCAPLATRCLRRKKETKKTCLLSATLAAWMNNWLSSGGRLAEAGTADFVCVAYRSEWWRRNRFARSFSSSQTFGIRNGHVFSYYLLKFLKCRSQF